MLLLVLVPALLMASVLAGNVLLVHQHDAHGQHVHVVEEGGWHVHPEDLPAAEHGPGDELASALAHEHRETLHAPLSAEREERAPLRFSFQGNWSFTALGPWAQALPARLVAGFVAEPREGLARCAPPPAGAGPPGRARGKPRSGIAAVVMTGRSIRI